MIHYLLVPRRIAFSLPQTMKIEIMLKLFIEMSIHIHHIGMKNCIAVIREGPVDDDGDIALLILDCENILLGEGHILDEIKGAHFTSS